MKSKNSDPLYHNTRSKGEIILKSIGKKGQNLRKFLVRHKALFQSTAALMALLAFVNPLFDFSISVDGLNINQPIEIGRGESQNLNLTINGGIGLKALGSTPIGKIFLEPIDVPKGLNASMCPKLGCPLFHSAIAISVDDNATEGSKMIVLRGVGPLGRAKPLEINLQIVETRYFEIIGDKTQITAQKNNTANIPIHIIRDQDYIKQISFRTLGLPAGVEPSFNPVNPLPDISLSTLQLKINPEAKIGLYNFSVIGTGADNKTAYFNMSLNIESSKYFEIKAIPSLKEIKNGENSLILLELTSVNNYSGNVELSMPEYPEDIITVILSKQTSNLSSSSPKDTLDIALKISDDAVPGESYSINVNGKGQDGSSANCSIAVIIEDQEGSFKISPEFSSMLLKPGESKNCEVTIEGIDGYEGAITLSVSDVPGITANIDPNRVTIDAQDKIASCQLSVHAQAEADSAGGSDMIISGSDARKNCDESRIEISVENEPAAEPESPVEPKVVGPQISAFPENVEPPVEQPSVADPPAINPDVTETPEIKVATAPEVQADHSPENTTTEEFFNEISEKNVNYINIPIESISSDAKNRWYKNDPSSANYVGEYEIRKELYYSRNEYTVKVVLDDQSKPIDVIFMQDANVVSEVPSGFVDQAMRKLSNL